MICPIYVRPTRGHNQTFIILIDLISLCFDQRDRYYIMQMKWEVILTNREPYLLRCVSWLSFRKDNILWTFGVLL